MADLNKIVDDLSSLTVLEAAELSKMLEEKWGVSAAAPVAAVAAQTAGSGDAPAEEKSEFDVVCELGSNLGYRPILSRFRFAGEAHRSSATPAPRAFPARAPDRWLARPPRTPSAPPLFLLPEATP